VYEVVAPIGAGGMGEVYRARDTRLERSVAIKVLPAEFAADASLKLRFEREAKTISALSHPNICSLFDVGETGDRAFLVMEYLEGESLADRLSKGPLPIDQVLKLGVEIASALDSAHRQGIIHRDIKPGNIMLTKSGAKLLDFGLARVSAPDILAGPTEVKPITEQGTILGTYQYMAPEQVEGRTADARTDLFALGAVLYEAATGQRAFDGKSRASLIAAILDHEPPPIPTVRPFAPMSLDRVVRACLRKDPNDRVQTAHDLMLQLTWIRESTSTGEAAVPVKPRRRINWIAATLAVTTIVFAALYARTRMMRAEPVTFSVLPAAGTVTGESVALSPDGKSIAYAAARTTGGEPRLWIRRFADAQPKEIAGTEGLEWPFWSPDGQSIGFWSLGKLRRVDLATGSVHVITDGHYGVGATWNRDGTIVFAKRFNDALYRVRAAGGDSVPVTRLDTAKQESVHGWPVFLEDDEHFAFLIRTVSEERNQIAVASLNDGRPKTLVRADALAGVSAGRLLYVRDTILYAHEFDEDALELRGDPVEIARDVFYAENWAASAISVAGSTIVYAPIFVPRSEVREYDRQGTIVRTLFADDGIYTPQLSPDGKRLVFARFDPKKGAADIWIFDPLRNVRTRLTGGLSNHRDPSWSADGSKILFTSDRAAMYDLYVQSADDAGPAQVIWKSDRDKQNAQWMPDGRVVTMMDDVKGSDLYIVGEKPEVLLASDLQEDQPAVSPDGKWLAFISRRTAQEEVYVRPLAGGRVIQISSRGGYFPAWSRDGSELFFVAPDRMMHVVAFRGGDPDVAKPLFVLPRTPGLRPFSLTPAGTFLVAAYNLAESAPDRFDVMLHWQAKLKD
jgi:eukaryotic-like serine/threonine-protein kinase